MQSGEGALSSAAPPVANTMFSFLADNHREPHHAMNSEHFPLYKEQFHMDTFPQPYRHKTWNGGKDYSSGAHADHSIKQPTITSSERCFLCLKSC